MPARERISITTQIWRGRGSDMKGLNMSPSTIPAAPGNVYPIRNESAASTKKPSMIPSRRASKFVEIPRAATMRSVPVKICVNLTSIIRVLGASITRQYSTYMDEETRRLMKEYDIDEDTAEKAQELIDEGFDEDDAVELADEL